METHFFISVLDRCTPRNKGFQACCVCSTLDDIVIIIKKYSVIFKAYLFQLVELLPDGLVLDLQVIVLLFELLLLLQHRQSILRRLDLLVRGLTQLPGKTLDLGPHPLRPGL